MALSSQNRGDAGAPRPCIQREPHDPPVLRGRVRWHRDLAIQPSCLLPHYFYPGRSRHTAAGDVLAAPAVRVPRASRDLPVRHLMGLAETAVSTLTSFSVERACPHA